MCSQDPAADLQSMRELRASGPAVQRVLTAYSRDRALSCAVGLAQSDRGGSLDLPQIDFVSDQCPDIVQSVPAVSARVLATQAFEPSSLRALDPRAALNSLDHGRPLAAHTPPQHPDILGDPHRLQHFRSEDTRLARQLHSR